MSAWTGEELERIGDATEPPLASRRDDQTLGADTTMWAVRVGDDLYVRSAGGPTGRDNHAVTIHLVRSEP